MLRRLNFTGRKRIPGSCITISLIEDSGKRKSFQATIDIIKLDFPREAKVYLEAYRRMMQSHRFNFGTIDNIIHPSDTSLGFLGLTDNIKFRLMITNSNGRILGLVENLKLIDEPKKEALLPVDVIDLDDLLWNIQMIEYQDAPVLELNNRENFD